MSEIFKILVSDLGLGLTLLSLVIWIGLLAFRGQFWRTDQCLIDDIKVPAKLTEQELYPSVCAVVPARNEADLLPVTLRSLLNQNYPGSFLVILVDDYSTDGTASVAQQVAQDLNKSSQLQIISGVPLPPGWTGKLWAMEQGINQTKKLIPPPDYLLLTDADIEHDSSNLVRLVAKAQQDKLDLVSLMVLLRCQDFWEQLLIPAFVFFFQKLYPFRWVNNPTHPTAAAAGGCILMRSEALNRIGGIQVVRQALIDDCALAQAVKSTEHLQEKGRLWLGLTALTRSLRPYPSLKSIWSMVARTAYTQLNYSPLLLLGTVIGMTLVYLIPPIAAILGGITSNWLIAIAGLGGWLLMSASYFPTIRFYRCSPWFAFALPAIAFLYTLMTLDSALGHWQGRGGAWKGRVYSER